MIALVSSVSSAGWACTLWGAAGDSVEDGGTLLAKNRDWVPDHQQVLKKVPGRLGRYAFVGLYAEDSEAPGFKSGVNEKGLAVEIASASCIPKADRLASGGKKTNLVKILLERYGSVAEALKDQGLFAGCRPGFFLLADKDTLGWVEISQDGKASVKTQTDGTLAHTNHYLDSDFASSNIKVGTSSQVRLSRVSRLLDAAQDPWTLDGFIKVSQDQTGGPDNSLWRTGTNPGDERTLATWIVRLPKTGAPVVYLKLANPDALVQIQQFTLGPDYWN